jgi:hypothetical protein
MTDPQLTAFNNPCFHAEQCANEKYFTHIRLDEQVWAIGLTANIGLE